MRAFNGAFFFFIFRLFPPDFYIRLFSSFFKNSFTIFIVCFTRCTQLPYDFIDYLARNSYSSLLVSHRQEKYHMPTNPVIELTKKYRLINLSVWPCETCKYLPRFRNKTLLVLRSRISII